jgi:hypothetical protein
LDDVLPTARGLLLMLKVYMDRGAKADAGGIMCVAAAMFKPAAYKRLCREWKRLLEGWGAGAFHATDFYPGGGEFRRTGSDGQIDPRRVAKYQQDSKRIPHIIGNTAHKLFVVSFRQFEFEAVAPIAWQRHFGSLYGVALQLALDAIGHWANSVKYHGKIAYFIESGDEGQADADRAFLACRTDPGRRAHTRFATHTFGAKGMFRGCEVADFIGWQWNKFYADTLATDTGAPRRDMRKDLEALLLLKHGLLEVFLFTGPTLEKFLIERGCTRTPPTDVPPAARES